MRLRVRDASGTKTVSSDTVAQLLRDVGAAPDALLKHGFPPKTLAYHLDATLDELGLHDGDTLVVEASPAAAPPPPTAQPAASACAATGAAPKGEHMVRRVIAADNSCLFNAVAYVLEGGVKAPPGRARVLRQHIASVVLQGGERFSEAMLGREPSAYAKWILDDDKWGGATELDILSEYYSAELAAVDVQTNRVDIFGQERGYSQRAFLLYDGIHYDALACVLFAGAPQDLDVTLFDVSDEAAVSMATCVASEAREARAFTDTSSFSLRCLVCQKGLVGEKEARWHAKETGHTNFGEF